MSTSLHTFGWTDPTTLLPENGCQLFYRGWLPVIPADDGVHPPGMAPRRHRDEDWIMAVIVAFLRMRGQ